MMLRAAVVGAGLIGAWRAASAAKQSHLEIVADIDETRAVQLARRYGCRHTTKWEDVVADPRVDVVAVCTINKFLAPVAIAALNAGKHVLCEKPLGRNTEEASAVASVARRTSRIFKVGFNLRFHPAIRQAHDIYLKGELGPLLFIRAVYGHGGRPGYETEWRGNSEMAGGGELLDQGVHLLDLTRWFLGEASVVGSVLPRLHWEVAPLEDNAFVLLQTKSGQIASLHASWTQWRNRFSFEVFGRNGYARVDGLGGSYGVETLTVGQRLAEGGVPHESAKKFDGPDSSWDDDWNDFVVAVEHGSSPEVGAEDGLAVMRLVGAAYATGLRIYDASAITVPQR